MDLEGHPLNHFFRPRLQRSVLVIQSSALNLRLRWIVKKRVLNPTQHGSCPHKKNSLIELAYGICEGHISEYFFCPQNINSDRSDCFKNYLRFIILLMNNAWMCEYANTSIITMITYWQASWNTKNLFDGLPSHQSWWNIKEQFGKHCFVTLVLDVGLLVYSATWLPRIRQT